MSDVQEVPTEKARKPRDVSYDGELVLDEIPDTPRRSPLQDRMTEIEADPSLHNKWRMLASYGNKNGAASAANTQRAVKGNSQAAMGWAFKPYAYETDDGESRNALMASFNPDAITEEAALAHQKKLKEAKLKAAAKKREKAKAAAAASASNGG